MRVVAVVGPTATGKSRLALALAERLGGELVNADSRQVYRGLDVGTAKPPPADRARLPHHLYDVVDPDEPFTLSDYLRLARAAIADVAGRGRLPILVGGTGLYVRAVLDGLAPPAVAPDPALRAALEARAATEGPEALLAELRAADPVAAARIDRRNVRRLIRAIEVVRATGRPFSAAGAVEPPPYRTVRLAIAVERAALYRRVDERVDAMIGEGLIDEVRGLLARGYDPALPAMTGIGYREIAAYLRGETTLAAASQAIKWRTHRFVRQQYTWFRPDDPAITWLPADAPDLVERAIERIRAEG